MKRGGKTLDMVVSTPEGLFGTSYDFEVKKQKPNYDTPPYNRWPNGEYYEPFVDSWGVYDPEALPFHVNELPQLRTSYDSDKIESLAERLKTGEAKPPHIKLEQAIRIAEFTDPQSLQQFLGDFQLFHNLDEPVDLGHFDPEPSGAIRILNYGHRRTRAALVATKPLGYRPLNKDIKKEIVENPTFEQFISAQSRENEHDRPSLEDEAIDIRKHFDYYTAKNNDTPPTKAWLARKMGLGEGKVRDALRFTDLSPRIMEWYDNGIINYAVAVECWRLREAAKVYYPQKYPNKYPVGSGKLAADAEALVLAELTQFARSHMQGASYEKKLRVVEAKIRSLDITKQQVALFDDSEYDDPQNQNRIGGKNMARYAVMVLEHRMGDAGVTDEELIAVESLYLKAKVLRQVRHDEERRLAQEASQLASFTEHQALFA